MAHFIYSAFCDESGENTIGGQMAACKSNGITHMELRGFGKTLNINNLSVAEAIEMKGEIDKKGMKVSSIGSGYGKINIKERTGTFLNMLDFLISKKKKIKQGLEKGACDTGEISRLIEKLEALK